MEARKGDQGPPTVAHDSPRRGGSAAPGWSGGARFSPRLCSAPTRMQFSLLPLARATAAAMFLVLAMSCGTRCVPGREAACICASGARGSSVCNRDGSVSACRCTAPSRVDAGSEARDAGTPPYDAGGRADASATVDISFTHHFGDVGPSGFGGPPYCAYEAYFDGLFIDGHIGPDGIDRLEASGIFREVPIDCPYPGLPASGHSYTWVRTLVEVEGAMTATLSQIEGGPAAAAELFLFPSGGGAYHATLRIARTDSVPELNWVFFQDFNIEP